MPLIQKDIIKRCIKKAKPVVVATQMMDSMIENPNPTRAEITDVANAVIDGADAVMLSGETSVGKHPIRVIEIMQKISHNIEIGGNIYNKNLVSNLSSNTRISDTICYNAARMSEELNANGIVAMTFSGYSAFMISSFRPKANIFIFSKNINVGFRSNTAFMISSIRPKANIYIFTENKALLNTLSICWGVQAFFYDKFVGTDTSIRDVTKILKEKNMIAPGEIVINIGSMPLANRGRANMVKVTLVE
jgi:pyruvate kinase